jgi:hypothetical protein
MAFCGAAAATALGGVRVPASDLGLDVSDAGFGLFFGSFVSDAPNNKSRTFADIADSLGITLIILLNDNSLGFLSAR